VLGIESFPYAFKQGLLLLLSDLDSCSSLRGKRKGMDRILIKLLRP
jgi:hypothetical protein